MNYLPFVGYWFYGGANSTERANFFSSWGMVADLPTASAPATVWGKFRDWFFEIFR